jgi:hypothetical protein
VTPGFVASNGLESVWGDAVAQFGALRRHIAGGTEDNHEELYYRNHLCMRPSRMSKEDGSWLRGSNCAVLNMAVQADICTALVDVLC